MIYRKLQSRPIAVAAVVSLSISGLFGLAAPAYATTAANPTIIFDVNTFANSVPATENATSVAADSQIHSTQSFARTPTPNPARKTNGGGVCCVSG